MKTFKNIALIQSIALVIFCIPWFASTIESLDPEKLLNELVSEKKVILLEDWQATLKRCETTDIKECVEVATEEISLPLTEVPEKFASHMLCSLKNSKECANTVELTYKFNTSEIFQIKDFKRSKCDYFIFFSDVNYTFISSVKSRTMFKRDHWQNCMGRPWPQIYSSNPITDLKVYFPFKEVQILNQAKVMIGLPVKSIFGPISHPPMITSEEDFYKIANLAVLVKNKQGFYDFGFLVLAIVSLIISLSNTHARNMKTVATYLWIWCFLLFTSEEVMSTGIGPLGFDASIFALLFQVLLTLYAIPSIVICFMDIKIKRFPLLICAFLIGIFLVLGFSKEARRTMLIEYFGYFVLIGCVISTVVIIKEIFKREKILNILPSVLFISIYVISGFAQIGFLESDNLINMQLEILSSLGIVVYAFRKDAKEHSLTKEAKQMHDYLEKKTANIINKINAAKDFETLLHNIHDDMSDILGLEGKERKFEYRIATCLKPEGEKDYKVLTTGKSDNKIKTDFPDEKTLIDVRFNSQEKTSFTEKRQRYSKKIYKMLTNFRVFDFKNQANRAVAGPNMALLFGKESLAEVKLGYTYEHKGNVLITSADLESYGKYGKDYKVKIDGKEIDQGIMIVSAFQNIFTQTVENQMHSDMKKNAVYRYVGDQNISIVENPEDFYERFKKAITSVSNLNIKFKPIQGSKIKIRARIGLDVGPYKITMDGTEKQRDPNITSDHLITAVRLEEYAKNFGLLHLFSEEAVRFFTKSEKFQYLGTFETMRPDRKLKLFACEEFENIYRKENPIRLNEFSSFIKRLEKERDKDIIAKRLADFNYPTKEIKELFNKYSDCFIEHKRIIFKTKKS